MILLAAYCVIADHRGFTVALLRFGIMTYSYQELKTKRTLDEAYAYGARHKKHATKQGDKSPYPVYTTSVFFFPHLENSLPTECKHSVAFLALHNIAKQREWRVVDNYVNDDITNQITWLYSRCDLDIPLEEHINTYKSHIREVMFSVHDVWCKSIRKRIDRQAKSQDIKYTLESLKG